MTPNSSEFLNQIQQRGYWDIVIRPEKFKKDLIPSSELERVIFQTAVFHPNWSGFPMIDASRIVRRIDQISEALILDVVRQVWTFYCSGQFSAKYALFEDWRDESRILPALPGWTSGHNFPMVQAVVQISYAYEFASRLAQHLFTRYSVQNISVGISFHDLAGRILVPGDPSRMPFLTTHEALNNDSSQPQIVSTTALLTDWQQLGQDRAIKLFQHFGWATTRGMMADVQQRSYFP